MKDDIVRDQIYFNTAACGLVPEGIAGTGIASLQNMATGGSKEIQHWMNESVGRIRNVLARFIRAEAHNVAMIPSFSFGINGVVQSLKGTEKVLLYELDFPSLINPFRVNNFDISWLPAGDGFHVDIEAVFHKIKSEGIDLVALSHVQWLSGSSVNLKGLIDGCHREGARVILDTTQSTGSLPLFVDELLPDVLITSNYKWMNAGFGTGFLYLSDDFIENYPPRIGGIHSYGGLGNDTDRQPSALDYEPGHPNIPGFYIMEAAMQDKEKRGLEAIHRHNHKLTSQFIEACPHLPVSLIGPATMDNRSPIVVLKDENGLSDHLVKHNFIFTSRNATVRLAFHYYNTEAEVAALIQCIRTMQ